MYRRGIVSVVDAQAQRARVTFPEEGDLESGWLEVLVRDALDDREQGLPSVGAQVAVLLDEREESGCVLGALYSAKDTAPAPQSVDVRRWTMKDGARFEYDRSEHRFAVDLPEGSNIEVVVGGVKVTAAADVELLPDGLLKVAGASDFVALAQKVDDAISAIVQALNDLVTAYNAHVHPTGVGPSGPPPPGTPLAPQGTVACTKVKTD